MVIKTFRTLCICLAAALLTMTGAAGFSVGDAGAVEIVSIDTNRILQQHPAFREAQQTFQGEMQQMEQQLQEMGEEQRMMAQQQMQQQLQQRGQELQQEALGKVREEIRVIADEKGYQYVVDANALIVGGKDITEEVLEKMDLEGSGE